ncbi:MAG: hypothetical protein ACOYVF_12135 [Candidatus Zixiibacteriota bacterium]
MEKETQKRAGTLKALLRYLFHIVILSVALVMIPGGYGIRVGAVLAVVGIVARHLVSDTINGVIFYSRTRFRSATSFRWSLKAGRWKSQPAHSEFAQVDVII